MIKIAQNWKQGAFGVVAALAGALGLAGPADAANTVVVQVGVDVTGVYQDVTRFSISCHMTQGSSSAGGRIDGVQLLRDLVNGRYVGRWKDTLPITMTERGAFDFAQSGGTFGCGLFLDDADGHAGSTAMTTINGIFPISYSYFGQFTYRGRPPRLPPTPEESLGSGGTKFGGMNGVNHVFKP